MGTTGTTATVGRRLMGLLVPSGDNRVTPGREEEIEYARALAASGANGKPPLRREDAMELMPQTTMKGPDAYPPGRPTQRRGYDFTRRRNFSQPGGKKSKKSRKSKKSKKLRKSRKSKKSRKSRKSKKRR
tara:strand:- start:23 stop:412 length:390 start_codon:yes stop_codon:yes gene_type:complete